MEAVLPDRLDVFVSLRLAARRDPPAILSPIYEHLRAKGYETDQ